MKKQNELGIIGRIGRKHLPVSPPAVLALALSAILLAGCGAASSAPAASETSQVYMSASNGTGSANGLSQGTTARRSAASADNVLPESANETLADPVDEAAATAAYASADTSDSIRTDQSSQADVSDDAAEAADQEAAAAAESDTSADIRKKIVYSGDVYLQTKNYTSARSQLEKLISQYGGFIESSNEYDNGSEDQPQRSCYVTAKIPEDRFNDFMNGLGQLDAKVTSRSISSDDMTRTYSDNADRIAALETEQKTLLELIAKADSVDSMIAIQQELTNVRAELAQLHHANSGIDYDVKYSSVSISLDEVVTYASTQAGFGERIRDAFGESGAVFVDVVQEVAIGLIYLLPYIIIVGVLALVTLAIRRKKKKQKAAAHSLPVATDKQESNIKK